MPRKQNNARTCILGQGGSEVLHHFRAHVGAGVEQTRVVQAQGEVELLDTVTVHLAARLKLHHGAVQVLAGHVDPLVCNDEYDSANHTSKGPFTLNVSVSVTLVQRNVASVVHG